jgi:hypothetical protein
MAETLGIVALSIPGSNLGETLGQKGTEGMGDRGWVPLVRYGGGKACGEAHLPVATTQQEGAKVRRQGAAFNIGPHGLASKGRKSKWCWRRIRQKQTSWGFSSMAASHTPFYQRLRRGWCFFMKNSG